MEEKIVFRAATEDDYINVQGALAHWWGDVGGPSGVEQRASLLPRLFFQHFADSSTVVYVGDELVGFLVGFLSQSRGDEAYVHFVGVSPEYRGQGLGAELYRRFFETARTHGRRTVRAITSVGNTASQDLHRRLGFAVSDPVANYDGRGGDRVMFERSI